MKRILALALVTVVLVAASPAAGVQMTETQDVSTEMCTDDVDAEDVDDDDVSPNMCTDSVLGTLCFGGGGGGGGSC